MYSIIVIILLEKRLVMKVLKVFTIIFAILTLFGAIYVIYSKGHSNAGYAVVPMLFCLLFSNWDRLISKKHKLVK